MKVSLRMVEILAGFALPPVGELVQRVNARLGKVEVIIDLKAKYKDATIVRVMKCEKHPNADKLSVCQIDTGADELVQVVCGAPNVHADMCAVWLPPESVVPSTFDDEEPFKLGARELRGIMSHGMLAAGDELGINSDHDGIIEITEYDLQGSTSHATSHALKAGASFAATFGLDDTVIDIENKMFTHRPDLFGQLGVAREIAGIYGKQFTSPDWYGAERQFASVENGALKLDVRNDAPEKASRFMAVVIRNITVKPSPLWLQIELVRMGGKPVNNIVDATNYLMLMTAQPTHAYDYDTLRGQKLGVRMAKNGEKAALLNGKTYELNEDDIVIVDGERPVGLAGIMGGLDTEVTAETTNIVLECATFDMYAVRKSAMRHGLFTDALTRFNKGQSPLQNANVLAQLMEMIGGEVASEVFDLMSPQADDCVMDDGVHRASGMGITTEFIGERLGTVFEKDEIKRLLENVELKVDIGARGLDVYEPFWRMDIEEPEDIVEEVGRLYGFDALPRELPLRSTRPAPKNKHREVKRIVRESLSRAGANEVLTYSFVHENIFKKAEQNVAQAFRLSNALNPDLHYYRLSVLPSLLDKVHMNIKAGHDEFTLFEIGKGHNKEYHADDDDGLPKELVFVDAVYASKRPQAGAAFYRVRRFVDQLAKDMGLQVVYKPLEDELDYPVTAPFDFRRSALIETTDGVFIGMAGELKQGVARNFKLPEYTAAMTLDFESIVTAASGRTTQYQPLSRYPSVTQDVSLKIPADQHYHTLYEHVRRVLDEVAVRVDIQPVSVYQSEDDTTTKTVTFRLTFTSYEATLSDKDVAPIVQCIEQLML